MFLFGVYCLRECRNCIVLLISSAKPSHKQRKQFYSISLGSFKEARAIMQLYPKQTETIGKNSRHTRCSLIQIMEKYLSSTYFLEISFLGASHKKLRLKADGSLADGKRVTVSTKSPLDIMSCFYFLRVIKNLIR